MTHHIKSMGWHGVGLQSAQRSLHADYIINDNCLLSDSLIIYSHTVTPDVGTTRQ